MTKVARQEGLEPEQGVSGDDAFDGESVRKLALANAGVGIWQLTIGSDELSCDETASRLFDCGGQSHPNKRSELLERIHPDDREDVALRLELCSLTDAPMHCSFRLAVEGDDDRWLELTAKRAQTKDGGLISLGTLRDTTNAKRDADALVQSQSCLATVFSQTMVGILQTDRNNNVLMVNDRFLKLVGRTAEELSGLSFKAYTHPDDLVWNAPLFYEKIAKGEPFTVEKRYVRPDGSTIWCEVNISFVPGPDGIWRSIIIFAHEITDRKLVELEQNHTRDMLELALDGAGAGIFEMDLTDKGRLHLSPNALHIYGLPKDHDGILTHEEWAELVAPDCLAKLIEESRKSAVTEDSHSIEFKIRRPDGEERHLRSHGRTIADESGKPLKIVGLFYDDSARIQAEEELRKSEKGLRLTQEVGRIGTFVVGDNGTVFGSRQYFCNLGLPEGMTSMDRKEWQSLIHPDDVKRVLQGFAESNKVRADFHEDEHRIIRSDNGEVRWILARVGLERNEDGQVTRLVGVHLDITEAKCAAQDLQETKTLNQGIIDSSTDCIKVLDLDGTMKFMSQRGLEVLEVDDLNAILNTRWQDLWPKEAVPKVEEAIARACAGEVGRFNAGAITFRGNSMWLDTVVTPLRDENGIVTQLLAVTRDMTELRRQTEQVRWTADHDTLTGLPSRNYFEEQLARILAAAEMNGENVGLLALDVDNFKQVNDAFGHDAGDTLLKSLSRRLEEMLDEGDFAARIGGDEFAIIVRHVEKGRDLLKIGKAINARLKEPIAYQGFLLDCRVSIGAAASPEHGDARAELLKSADTALYAVKSDGQNDILLFDKSQRSELERRSAMIGMARLALERCDIVPFYQPKVCLRTGRIEGFEALLRWRDASGSICLPSEIEAAFEDFELAHQISERMQDCIIKDMRIWLDAQLDIGNVAINAAAAEFSRNDFAARLLGKLDEAGVEARYLQVEVTETVFLGRGADHVGSALLALKARGVEIALDDFGTGYASLSHLKDLPVDVIKIDRSFIADFDANSGDTAIVCALLGLAKKLNMTTVAEGIETEAQAEFLKKRGCDFGQGYLFGKAVSAKQIPALLGITNLRSANRDQHCSASSPFVGPGSGQTVSCLLRK